MVEGVALIEKYFPGITPRQKEQFEALGKLYPEWNEKINLISRKDIAFLYEKHILHSLGIGKVLTFQPGTLVLDVGTGGGFPGIPLAILFPEVQFHLVDSIGKKIKVVKDVASELRLVNVTTDHTRAENVEGEFEFVVSRAVTDLKTFYGWVKNKISTLSTHDLPNGVLYLKGGDLSEELRVANLSHQIYSLSDFFTEEFFETKKVIYVKRGRK